MTNREPITGSFDAVVVGAGVAGLYGAYRLRELGITFQGIEAGTDVGGTWFWNRYPGCRCDVPTIEYSYSWDEELEREWSFPETMSTQPEIERYLNHVADRHDLRRHFLFETRVVSAIYDESTRRWEVRTQNGDVFDVRWCVMATGSLSAPNFPDIAGIDRFEGELLHTGLWPREDVDLAGKRVGIIGTGSSGMQSIPKIAEVADQLTVFQRTPNYAFPAVATPTDPEFEAYVKANYRELRRLQRSSAVGISGFSMPNSEGTESTSVGFGALADLRDLAKPELNKQLQAWFADSVRSRVRDPEIAESLIPKDYPFGCKRLVVEIGYFETFNRDNVTLVDLRKGGITEITERCVVTEQGSFEIDVLIVATGFDALTGPLTRIDVRGKGGVTLRDKWSGGPSAYLGYLTAGFPNFFLITGPGSPSVLSNMMVSIEQHIDLTADVIAHMVRNDVAEIDVDPQAEAQWSIDVRDVAEGTQFTAPTCNSWYLGANIEGKARHFLPYVGGVDRYRKTCDDVVADGFRGFLLTPNGRALSDAPS